MANLNEPAGEHYYRYYDSGGDYILLMQLRVLRRTPKGVWVEDLGGLRSERFVLDRGRKRFCYPTLAEAWASFLKRKERQLSILVAQHDMIARLLARAKLIPPDEVLAKGSSGIWIDKQEEPWFTQ